MMIPGSSVSDYESPLFFAWQLTNRCTSRCLHCCEESGPDKGWKDELSREQALRLAREIVELRIPYVAFGGGEPLGVPHVWEVFEILTKGGVELKIETNGLLIGDKEADRLKELNAACVQISVDGASAKVHEALRPEGPWRGAWDAIDRLVTRGLEPELVFIPTRLNVADAPAVYDLAAARGVRTFVTGPMMRLGRAAYAWDTLAASEEQWAEASALLRAREKMTGGKPRLALYPWGIQQEMLTRAQSPQAMTLVVPNGRVKLLNALPFAVGDLKTERLKDAWPKVGAAWASAAVQDFVRRAQTDARLLTHANECWDLSAADLAASTR
jgi:MoaA/NifB/PqqE/SkfB family radical SAM enzyme